MKRFPALAAALLAVAIFPGCSHIPFFGKKKTQDTTVTDKGSSKIASDTENDFLQRWVTKRANELVSQGLTQDAARAQATAEFKQTFSATHIAQDGK